MNPNNTTPTPKRYFVRIDLAMEIYPADLVSTRESIQFLVDRLSDGPSSFRLEELDEG